MNPKPNSRVSKRDFIHRILSVSDMEDMDKRAKIIKKER